MTTRALLIVFLFAGCSPTLTPIVERTAVSLTVTSSSAHVIWVLDKSGSMAAHVDPTCIGDCETRKSALLGGLAQAEATMPAGVTHSAVLFPRDNVCGPPDTVAISHGQFSDVVTRYEATAPGGGTPTSATLNFVAGLPVAANTETFVVLVTDGLPNCNPDNPNNICGGAPTADQQAACDCQTSNCLTTSFCALGCLDALSTAQASQTLATSGGQLLLVGLGADLDGVAGNFASMQVALPARCDAGGTCAHGTCGSNGLCSNPAYAANTSADFATPMARLQTALTNSARCTWWSGTAVTASGLSVTLGDSTVPESELSVSTSGTKITLSGASCQALLTDAQLVPSMHWLAPLGS